MFAHAYEPLLRADCTGRLTPALAASWTSLDGGARARIVLRDSARFWNGDLVTARDVIASWTSTGRDPQAVLARRLARSASVIDDRTLDIACEGVREAGREPRECELLSALGDGELVVHRRVPGARWPEGTGTYRIRDAASTPAPAGARGTFVLEPTEGAAGPRVTMHAVGGVDARDLVDADVDLLLTEDPALAAYAAARSEVASLPLPWDRTWGVLTPTSRALALDTVVARTVAFRAALARDVVRADARAAETPEWWHHLDGCTSIPPNPQTGAPRSERRVAARSDEPIARALAERLVALASAQPEARQDSSLLVLLPQLRADGGRVTAIALAPNDFATAVRAGHEVAYVASLPYRSLVPCIEAERLRTVAPWLADDGSALRTTRIAPLIDTRLRAVVRRDWLALTMTGDSTVVMSLP